MRDTSARDILKVSRTTETSSIHRPIPGCSHSILHLQLHTFWSVSPGIQAGHQHCQASSCRTPEIIALHSPADAGKEHRALQSACKSHWLMWMTLLSTDKPALCDSLRSLHCCATMNKTFSEPILFSDNTFHILFFLVTSLHFFSCSFYSYSH